MYSYKQILAKALTVSWRNPILWLFGLFVTLLGQGGEFEVLLGGYIFGHDSAVVSLFTTLRDAELLTSTGLQGMLSMVVSHPVFIVLFLLGIITIVTISAVSIWLMVSSQGALIAHTVGILSKKSTTASESFKAGLAHFWRLLGINATVRISIALVFVLINLPAYFNFTGSAVIFVLLFDLLIAFAIFFSLIGKYAACGVMLKNWGFKESFQQSWNLFKQNWLLTTEVAVILFVIYALANSVLWFLAGSTMIAAIQLFEGFIFPTLLLVSIVFAVFAVLQIVLIVFQWVSWIIVFELLTSKKQVLRSWLHTIFHRS